MSEAIEKIFEEEQIPEHILNKMHEYQKKGYEIPDERLIKRPSHIKGIIESAKINTGVLDAVASKIHVGMSTQEIDDIVSSYTHEHSAICAPYHYEGYPKSVCTSINDEVCHGIPSDDIILMDGDIVNVDCSTIYNGYFSDSSRMFMIGNVPEEMKRLVEVTKECVEIGLKEVKPYAFLGDMGEAVHNHAVKNGYSVVEDIGGHGVALKFHEEPWVSYVSRKGTEMLLVPGMMFTIEPMVNMGEPDIYIDEDNGWTVYTDDGLPSAQWEIQVLVTNDGYEVIAW